MAIEVPSGGSLDQQIAELANQTNIALDNLKASLSSGVTDYLFNTQLNMLWSKTLQELNKKQDTAEGKGLSANDYTNEDKAKVGTIASLEARIAALEAKG
jgi:hypothetical protein